MLALLLMTSCRVEIGIGVNVESDGSGELSVTLTLDREAAEAEPEFRVDDLRRAGWTVRGPVRTSSGGALVEAKQEFANSAELATIVQQLDAGTGLFKDFRIVRERSFLRTVTTFEGTVDLSSGIEAFGDDDLRERLGGAAIDVEELERQARAPVERVFPFRVAVRLPGDVASNAPTETSNGAVGRPVLGERVTLEATGRRTNIANIVWLAASILAALAAIAVVLRRRR